MRGRRQTIEPAPKSTRIIMPSNSPSASVVGSRIASAGAATTTKYSAAQSASLALRSCELRTASVFSSIKKCHSAKEAPQIIELDARHQVVRVNRRAGRWRCRRGGNQVRQLRQTSLGGPRIGRAWRLEHGERDGDSSRDQEAPDADPMPPGEAHDQRLRTSSKSFSNAWGIFDGSVPPP